MYAVFFSDIFLCQAKPLGSVMILSNNVHKMSNQRSCRKKKSNNVSNMYFCLIYVAGGLVITLIILKASFAIVSSLFARKSFK